MGGSVGIFGDLVWVCRSHILHGRDRAIKKGDTREPGGSFGFSMNHFLKFSRIHSYPNIKVYIILFAICSRLQTLGEAAGPAEPKKFMRDIRFGEQQNEF